jgi:V8-like Glu-specific endopeptidase
MANKVTWDSARELVRQQDITGAVDLLEKWLQGRLSGPNRDVIRSWLDELILHFASAKSVERKTRQGLITREDAGVELRQISISILSLINEIEREDLSSGLASHEPGKLPPAYEEGKFEKIIGNKSRLQMISWLERGLSCSTGVCRLVSGNCLGTGFRVAGNLLITNNHVIESAEVAKKFSAQFFFEERVDHTMKETVTVELDSTRFWTSSKLDLSIVGAYLKADPQTDAIVSLNLSNASCVAVGDPVSIIQHPLGGPKQIALTSNEIINIYGHRIQYVTDTLPGSSGAPVFDSSWNVIAAHHAGGQLLKNAAGDRVFANEGIDISVLSDIEEVKRLMFETYS